MSRLDCLPFIISPSISSVSLTPANSSLRSIQFRRSVSVVPRFPRSVSAFQRPPNCQHCPGRLLAHYVTTYTATTTIPVPYVDYIYGFYLETGPTDHCYLAAATPDSTQAGSRHYGDAITECADTAGSEEFVFVYSSNLNEWLCYWYLFLSNAVFTNTYRSGDLDVTCDSSVTAQGYLALSSWSREV